MTVLASPPQPQTWRTVQDLLDLLDRLGNIPASRVRLSPFPGTATERDVTYIQDHENRTCELIDGTLVEKAMGLRESLLAMLLVQYLGTFVRTQKLGVVSGPDGTMRMLPGLVRVPDVAFISRARLPGDRVRNEPIPDVIPDLAVEVLSESNTRAEIARKRREYFTSGVRLMWIIDLQHRSATIYTAMDQSVALDETGELDGADVVPGFKIALSQLFSDLDSALDGGQAPS